MRLLIATGLYPPDIGGPATYVKMLEAELPQQDIDLTVIPFSTVRKLPKLVRHLVYTWKVWRAAAGADIVYALDPVSVGVPAALAASLRRRPLVLRLGGDYAWEQSTERFGVTQTLDQFVCSKQPSWRVRTLQRFQTWVAARADIVIVPSKYLGSVVAKWGIDNDKIRVIYSVPHIAAVQETVASIRNSLGLMGTVIVSAGRLVPWKGFKELIAAMPKLLKIMPDAQLLVAGAGSERSKLEKIITDLKLENNVRLLGSVPQSTLIKYKVAADVYVLNTSYEGFSHDLLEVMSVGTPIVTTNIGGNPELITDGVEGLLIPTSDDEALVAAVMRIISNPELATRLTQHARATANAFTPEKSLKHLTAVLQSLYVKPS